MKPIHTLQQITKQSNTMKATAQTQEQTQAQTQEQTQQAPTATECQVCVNEFTQKNNAIQCPDCKYTACFQCYKQVILANPSNKARCMEPSCKKEFSQYFLHDNFQKTFLRKQYNEHLKEHYFQKESARLPETQDLLIRKDKHATRRQELITLIEIEPDNQYLHHLITFYTNIETYHTYADETTEPKFITSEEECYEFIDNYIEYGCIYGDPQLNPNRNHTQRTQKEYTHQYHGKCPVTNCRGFITEEYMCGICHIKVCHDCHVPLPETSDTTSTHTCNPETIETIKSISKETKPCPTCHVPIYKIDGCSQMWCVQCHTAFSWITGEIETQIHNPHYYEWMFSQANNNNNTNQHLEEIIITEEPPRLIRHFSGTTPWRLHEILKDKFTIMKYKIAYKSYQTPFEQRISDIQLESLFKLYYVLCQGVFHLANVRFRDLNHTNLEVATSELREKYLRNISSEQDFKQKLACLYKTNEYKETIDAIIQTHYVEPVKHIFENYLYDVSYKKEEDIQTTIIHYTQQLHQAVTDTDNQLERCAVAYNYPTFYKLKNHMNTRITLTKCKIIGKNKSNEFLENSFDI